MPKKRVGYYPIYLDIEGHDVLIVGGGEVCARKAATLLRYGARVSVVSPEVSDAVRRMASEGAVRLVEKSYDPEDLDASTLVIASTDDPCINARVARDSRRKRIPVNVVDVPHLCDFIVPAVIEQGSIQIAVSTGGKSPALARELRKAIETSIGEEWAEINDLLGRLRPIAKKALANDTDRKRLFDSILAAGVLELIRSGRHDEAIDRIAAICRDSGVPIAGVLPPGRS
jgi:precorrin-2 dehydrogenase/sirohydrochlorin ferrochelatase